MYLPQQLAESYKDCPNKASIFKGNHIIEAKIDGLRAELSSDASYSRYGNAWGFAPGLIKPLTDFLARAGVAIDGEWEYMGYGDGKLIDHYTRRRKCLSIMSKDRILNYELKDIVFRAFDVIPMNGNLIGWDRKKLLKQIMPLLQKACRDNGIPFRIEEVPYFVASSQKRFDEAFNWFVKEGYEGIMVKNMSAVYKRTRTFDWLKLKLKHTSDLPVLRVELGTKGKKNESRAGVVVVKTPKGEAKIGTGFPEMGKESRQWFFDNKDTIASLVLEIEHEGYANEKGNLLNAAFKGVRWDKPRGEMSF